jgi:hypothetical protein
LTFPALEDSIEDARKVDRAISLVY